MPAEPIRVAEARAGDLQEQTALADAGLEEARSILAELKTGISTDTETLGLWGAIHKRMWDLNQDAKLAGCGDLRLREGLSTSRTITITASIWRIC